MTALIDDSAPRDPEHAGDLARRFIHYFVLERGFEIVWAELVDHVVQLHLHLSPPRLVIDPRSPLEDRFWGLQQAMHYLAVGSAACPSATYAARPPLRLV